MSGTGCVGMLMVPLIFELPEPKDACPGDCGKANLEGDGCCSKKLGLVNCGPIVESKLSSVY